MSNIENGLPLGLKFYDNILKQKRYKYECRKGVMHNEYQYTDLCTIPPFQIRRSYNPIEDKELKIICVDTGEITDLIALLPAIADNIEIQTIGLYDYITYFGTHVCMNLSLDRKALFYATFSDTESTWYSELFWIDPDFEEVTTYYRLWAATNIRDSGAGDLRIYK